MKDQLNKIMEAEGMNPAKFADEIGVQRSSISHILNGRNKPSYDFISKVLKRFSGINAEWLITGKGSMIKSATGMEAEDLKQNTLFAVHGNKEPPQEQTIKNERLKVKTEKNADSADKYTDKGQSEKKQLRSEFTNVNNIKYILVFYTDDSFEQFIPRD